MTITLPKWAMAAHDASQTVKQLIEKEIGSWWMLLREIPGVDCNCVRPDDSLDVFCPYCYGQKRAFRPILRKAYFSITSTTVSDTSRAPAGSPIGIVAFDVASLYFVPGEETLAITVKDLVFRVEMKANGLPRTYSSLPYNHKLLAGYGVTNTHVFLANDIGNPELIETSLASEGLSLR